MPEKCIDMIISQCYTIEAVAEKRRYRSADVAQSAERILGKDKVTSSILVISSILIFIPEGGCLPGFFVEKMSVLIEKSIILW